MWDRHFGGTFTKEESVQDTKDTGHYDYKRLRIQNTKEQIQKTSSVIYKRKEFCWKFYER